MLTKTQRELLQFIANVPGKIPARTASRTLNALLTHGMIKRNDRMILVVTHAGHAYLTGGYELRHLPFNGPTPWNVNHACLGSTSFATEDDARKFMDRAVKREQNNPHACTRYDNAATMYTLDIAEQEIEEQINAAIAAAETAAAVYMRAVEASGWTQTPERIAAKATFLAAILAAYPAMSAESIYCTWDAYETKTIAEAVAIARSFADEDEMDA